MFFFNVCLIQQLVWLIEIKKTVKNLRLLPKDMNVKRDGF